VVVLIGSDMRGGGQQREGLPDALRRSLADLASRRPDLGFDVRWYDAVPSTMDIVADAAAAGERPGFVAIADRQTAGRGRRGHAWSSPPGAGLYFSYLARAKRHVGLVTLAAGVAVREGVARSAGVPAHLKWPNDVMVGRRKLAGLLAEGAGVGTPGASVTIGVGLNLRPAAYPPDVAVRATNLESEIGRPVAAEAVLVAILEQLADALRALDDDRPGDILQAWRRASPSSRGTVVAWHDGTSQQTGVTAGIDDAGALLVQTATGIERVIAGELQWRLPES
jgi:BirA family biotin operon repressor/biotin-[acetyl-CoA-carboxylase] ligase